VNSDYRYSVSKCHNKRAPEQWHDLEPSLRLDMLEPLVIE
jgi:hypothetical protein